MLHHVQVLRHFRVPLLTALAVGAVAGTTAFCGGPYVAASTPPCGIEAGRAG